MQNSIDSVLPAMTADFLGQSIHFAGIPSGSYSGVNGPVNDEKANDAAMNTTMRVLVEMRNE